MWGGALYNISYGEIKRGVQAKQVSSDGSFIKREKVIVDDYINGLMTLEAYDDKNFYLLRRLEKSGLYKESFEKQFYSQRSAMCLKMKP